MPEPNAGPELDQTRRLRRPRRGGPDPETLRSAPQQPHVADRLGSRRQEQLARLSGKPLEPAQEALLDAAGQRHLVRKRESARELRRLQPPGQLEQRKRVTARLGDDPVAYPLVQPAPDHRVQKCVGVAITQPADHEFGESCQLLLVASVAYREDQANRFSQQTASDERQRLRRSSIKPLSIIDEAQERALLSHPGKQAENGQTNEELVGRLSGSQPKCGAKRVALGRRKTVEAIEERCTQLVETGERELHLGLNAYCSRDVTSRGPFQQILQEGGLADTRLAAEDEHSAAPRPHTLE